MAKKKINRTLAELRVAKAQITSLAVQLANKDTELAQLQQVNTSFGEAYRRIAILLGVQNGDRESGLSQGERILLAISELKAEYAREDEASKVESEKAASLERALGLALHDTSEGTKNLAKMEVVKLLADQKINPELVRDILASFDLIPHREKYQEIRPWRPTSQF